MLFSQLIRTSLYANKILQDLGDLAKIFHAQNRGVCVCMRERDIDRDRDRNRQAGVY